MEKLTAKQVVDQWGGIRLVKKDWIEANADKSVPWSEFDRQTTRLSKSLIEHTLEILALCFEDKIIPAMERVDQKRKDLEAQLAETTHRLNQLERARKHSRMLSGERGFRTNTRAATLSFMQGACGSAWPTPARDPALPQPGRWSHSVAVTERTRCPSETARNRSASDQLRRNDRRPRGGRSRAGSRPALGPQCRYACRV